MTQPTEEAFYLLRRARQEQEQAAAADTPEAAAVHRELAMRYSIKALLVPVEDAEMADDRSAV
jgi:hypothetical protein